MLKKKGKGGELPWNDSRQVMYQKRMCVCHPITMVYLCAGDHDQDRCRAVEHLVLLVAQTLPQLGSVLLVPLLRSQKKK